MFSDNDSWELALEENYEESGKCDELCASSSPAYTSALPVIGVDSKKLYRQYAIRKWRAKRERRKFLKKCHEPKRVCKLDRSSVDGRFIKSKPKFISITELQ